MLKIILAAFWLCLLSANVSANTEDSIVGELPNKHHSEFLGYYYDVFEFTAGNVEDAFVAVTSTDFDAYLMVVDPQGAIRTNDDHNLPMLIGAGDLDAGLRVDTALAGRWVAVATSLRSASEGAFHFRSQGVVDTRRVSAEMVSQDLVTRVFEAKGVLSEQDAQRRDEERLQTEVVTLAERLSLRSFRERLMRELEARFKEADDRQAALQGQLNSLEVEEHILADALPLLDTLAIGSDVVRKLVERELENLRARTESVVSGTARAVSEREAFLVALAELRGLDRIAAQLEQNEGRLAESQSDTLNRETQDEISRLRAELVRLRVGFARKVIDSYIFNVLSLGENEDDRRPQEPPVGFESRLGRTGGAVYSGVRESDGSYGSLDSLSPMLPKPFEPEVWLPNLLPWPPPDASAYVVLDQRLLDEGIGPTRTLGELDDLLQDALAAAGYYGSSYFGVPQGFAIVTRIEQTDERGKPLVDEARWSAAIAPMTSLSLGEVLKRLVTAPPGYFRVLALVVSDKPFSFSGARAKLATIERWSREGHTHLPGMVRHMPFSEDHRVTALVYEFEKRRNVDEAKTHIPGRLTARDHLAHTRLSSFVR